MLFASIYYYIMLFTQIYYYDIYTAASYNNQVNSFNDLKSMHYFIKLTVHSTKSIYIQQIKTSMNLICNELNQSRGGSFISTIHLIRNYFTAFNKCDRHFHNNYLLPHKKITLIILLIHLQVSLNKVIGNKSDVNLFCTLDLH